MVTKQKDRDVLFCNGITKISVTRAKKFPLEHIQEQSLNLSFSPRPPLIAGSQTPKCRRSSLVSAESRLMQWKQPAMSQHVSDRRANPPINPVDMWQNSYMYIWISPICNTANLEYGFAARDRQFGAHNPLDVYLWLVHKCNARPFKLFCLQWDDRFLHFMIRDERNLKICVCTHPLTSHFKYPNHLQETAFNQMTKRSKVYEWWGKMIQFIQN